MIHPQSAPKKMLTITFQKLPNLKKLLTSFFLTNSIPKIEFIV